MHQMHLVQILWDHINVNVMMVSLEVDGIAQVRLMFNKCDHCIGQKPRDEWSLNSSLV